MTKGDWRKAFETVDEDTEETDSIEPYTKPGHFNKLLAAFGPQDEWCQQAKEDAISVKNSSRLLKSKYNDTFAQLGQRHSADESLRHRIHLKRQCDLINDLVLVIDNPVSSRLNHMIRSIELEIGGQQMDRFNCEDLETQIDALANTHGKQIEWIGDKMFVPLPMAMTHDQNFIAMYMLTCHKVFLIIHLNTQVDFAIYAHQFFLPRAVRDSVTTLEQLTHQVRYTGKEVVSKGSSQAKILLNFNHPTSCVFFWGIDKRSIRHAELLMDGQCIMTTDMDTLEYQHRRKGLRDPKVTYIFLSHLPYFTRDLSGLNLSRIDRVHLVLYAKTVFLESELFMCGINSQVSKTMSGMSGLVFSK